MVRTFRAAVWALVLAVPALGPSTAASAPLVDAQGAEVRGGCFDTITGACTGEPCSATQPCPAFNTFCTKGCVDAPPACVKDAECDDGEPCTEDVCVEGRCEFRCVCWSCPVDR